MIAKSGMLELCIEIVIAHSARRAESSTDTKLVTVRVYA
jgi:hypothetical protein